MQAVFSVDTREPRSSQANKERSFSCRNLARHDDQRPPHHHCNLHPLIK